MNEFGIFTCGFCKSQELGTVDESVVMGVRKVIEHMPSAWKHIENTPWCGECDPRRAA